MVVKIRWEDASVIFGWMSVTPNMPYWVSSLGDMLVPYMNTSEQIEREKGLQLVDNRLVYVVSSIAGIYDREFLENEELVKESGLTASAKRTYIWKDHFCVYFWVCVLVLGLFDSETLSLRSLVFIHSRFNSGLIFSWRGTCSDSHVGSMQKDHLHLFDWIAQEKADKGLLTNMHSAREMYSYYTDMYLLLFGNESMDQ